MTSSEFHQHLVELSRRRTAAEADHHAALRRLHCLQRAASGADVPEELAQRCEAAQVALDAAKAALVALEGEAAAVAKIPVTEDPVRRIARSDRYVAY